MHRIALVPLAIGLALTAIVALCGPAQAADQPAAGQQPAAQAQQPDQPAGADAPAAPAQPAEQAPAEPQEEKLTLDQAVAQGKVAVTVQSLGGATGSTIRVDVRSKVSHRLHIQITPGTVFLSTTGKVQNMTGGAIKGEFLSTTSMKYRPKQVMVLVDTNVHSYLIQSYCLEYHKPPPRRGDRFSIALLDQRAMRILQPPPDLKPSMWAFQCAIWIDRSDVSEAELRSRLRVSQEDLRTARALLQHAQQVGVATIPDGLAADVRVELEKVFSPDPQVRAEAAARLLAMGPRALPAIPLVEVNVDIERPGRWAAGQMPPPPASQQEAIAALSELGIPALNVLIERLPAAGGPPIGPGGPALPRLGDLVPGAGPGGVLADRLISNLEHPNVTIRRRAARLLGFSVDIRVIEPLIEALGDADEQVRQAAGASLGRITGQQMGTDRAAWERWWAEHKDSFTPGGRPGAEAPDQ